MCNSCFSIAVFAAEEEFLHHHSYPISRLSLSLMLPPSISTKAFGPDDSSLISDDSVGDVNVAKYVTHVETGAGTLSPFFISQTGERVPYGGQGSPRVAFLAVSDTQPELGTSVRALKGSNGYESVHTNVNSSVPDSFPSIASKLKQASKQVRNIP